jgi:hypothetical protein
VREQLLSSPHESEKKKKTLLSQRKILHKKTVISRATGKCEVGKQQFSELHESVKSESRSRIDCIHSWLTNIRKNDDDSDIHSKPLHYGRAGFLEMCPYCVISHCIPCFSTEPHVMCSYINCLFNSCNTDTSFKPSEITVHTQKET